VKSSETQALGIKNWAAEDRPREKLLTKGKSSLSEAELIAILIGSGTPKLSAVEVAKLVLKSAGNNLNNLAKLSAKDLMKNKGIGEAKAIAIVAALELGRRRKQETEEVNPLVSSSKDAFEAVKGDLMDLPHEEFWVLLLNRANRIVKKRKISEGGVSGTVADPKIIFKLALEELASGIIVVHNHPSGNLTASQSDIALTKKLKESGSFLEVQLLDHLILSGQKYFSFADEGLL
jgi:DNA repair protein RadC